MKDYTKKIESNNTNIRNQLLIHELYKNIKTIEDVKVFMKHHVFAVWDFMSLLKALQIELTCISIPWLPKGNPEIRYLINEIVVGEESDIDENGKRKSHYELYLEAMKQCNASTDWIENFLNNIKSGQKVDKALHSANVPDTVADFVNFTFEVIYSKKAHIMAAVFTFGREDLIPDMFHSIVTDINKKFPNNISKFKYYLDRHIEVDGGQHSHLALKMLKNLCENDEKKWEESQQYSLRALYLRNRLWHGVLKDIRKPKLSKI